MNQIGFFNLTEDDLSQEILILKKLINYAILVEQVDNVEFNVILADNKYLKRLNKKYRQKNEATDVISFALEDHQDIICYDKRLLGDIYISVDQAKKQASLESISLLLELARLLVHGFLHLLGYNHENEKEERVMVAKQELILNGYGIKKAKKEERDQKINKRL